MAKRLGECLNCGTRIRNDVGQCPECDYEPSAEGLFANRTVATAALGVFLLGAMLVLASLALPFSDAPLWMAAAGFAVSTLVTAASGWVLYRVYRTARRTPTGV